MRTWLIPRGRVTADDPAVRLLASIGLPNELLVRPTAYLHIPAEGPPCLAFSKEEDRKVFFDVVRVRAQASHTKQCLAFATNPAEELARLNVVEFTVSGGKYTAQRNAMPDLPYSNRLLTFGKVEGTVSGDVQVFKKERKSKQHRRNIQGYPLFIDPHLVNVSAEQFDVWSRQLRDWKQFLSGSNAIILPPGRSFRLPTDYFHSDRLAVRLAIRNHLPEYAVGDEPTVITIARATDEPELPDWLLEGAEMWVTNGDGEPTQVALRLRGATTGISGYRAAFVFSPSTIPTTGPAMSRDVRAVSRAVRADLLRLVSIVRRKRGNSDADVTQCWQVFENPAPETIDYRPPGSWLLLQRFCQRLPELARSQVQMTVLDRTSGPTKDVDNARAESAFLSYFFRCPSASPSAGAAWRAAVVALLTEIENCKGLPVAERFSGNGQPLAVIDPLDERRWLWHPRRAHRQTLNEWRLLAPLGWRLPERAAVLDGEPTTRLDAMHLG